MHTINRALHLSHSAFNTPFVVAYLETFVVPSFYGLLFCLSSQLALLLTTIHSAPILRLDVPLPPKNFSLVGYSCHRKHTCFHHPGFHKSNSGCVFLTCICVFLTNGKKYILMPFCVVQEKCYLSRCTVVKGYRQCMRL